jgi:hypothetical protein
LFDDATSGTVTTANVSSTKLTYNPSTGSLGINTTSPGSTLSVGGTITELYNGQFWNVVSQADVGYGASQVPLNQYLGQLAFLDDFSPNGLRRDGGGSDDVSVDANGNVSIGGSITVSGIATVNQLDVNQLSPDGVDFGTLLYVPVANGSGGWDWGTVASAGAGNLNGIDILEEGSIVGTAGSARSIDFRGNNIIATGTAGGSIATVRVSDTPTFNSLNVTGVSTFQGNVNLGDNDRLRIGDGNDLEIYHDGSNSYISNTTGSLYITDNGNNVYIQGSAGESSGIFRGNGAVELYYDNSKKFETTSTGISVSNGASTSATIAGPTELIIDPAAVGDNTGLVRIKGDLYVDGTQFVVNSTTIELADFNVGIATTVGTNLLLDGAGIGIGSTNIRKTITWNNTAGALTSSEDWNLVSGKQYEINGAQVLSSTTLGSGVVNSSLTSVGTLGQLNVSGVTTTSQLVSTVATGTAPLTVSSTTLVTNLNADLLDGYNTGTSGNTIPLLSGSNTWSNQQIVEFATSATNGHLYAKGATGALSREGKIRLGGTFGVGADTYSRLIASLRAGFNGNVWGTEYLDFYLNNATNDTASDVNQGRVMRLGFGGNVLIGSATPTGTASQPLQVTGGAYVSGSVGIGNTNPQRKLHVSGDVRFDTMPSFNAVGTIEINRSDGVSRPFYIRTHNDSVASGNYMMFDVHNGTQGNADTVMTLRGSGNVGIGTTNPQYKLHVVGSFGATTKSFIIDHPTKEGKKLQYGSLESPYHGIRLTGSSVIKNGMCVIELPEYIHNLVKDDGLNINITNIKHGKVIWVEEVNVSNNNFVVMTEEKIGEYEFYWDFTAIRKDVQDLEVEF